VPTSAGYTESVLYRFQGEADGANPWAGLTAGSGGVLFGTTPFGGTGKCSNPYGPKGCGTVFMLMPSTAGYTKTTIYNFMGGADGSNPLGDLLADTSGALYGTTQFGGNSACNIFAGSGCGTVFKLAGSASGYSKTTLHAFTGGTDGASPYGNVIVGAGGALFGTTGYGGTSGCGFGCGTVFELKPKQMGYSERVLYRFKGGKDGQWPKAGLIADKKGALYGTTETGGGTAQQCSNYVNVQGCGTIFKLTPSRTNYTETILHRFQYEKHDGAISYSRLVSGTNGALYGAAGWGGVENCSPFGSAFGCGIVFKLVGSGTKYGESAAYSFRGDVGLGRAHDGAHPIAGPISLKGHLYGTTSAGGKCRSSSSGCGIVYEVKP
jgi:uncharacterized repeat protein (TIGR03803 family)